MDHSITGTAPVTWTAPDIARVDEPVVGDERAIL